MILCPEIQAFAEIMQKELDANSKKGDWHQFTKIGGILQEIEWHKAKLLFALRDGSLDKITEHAADCANYFMMILNVNECLPNITSSSSELG